MTEIQHGAWIIEEQQDEGRIVLSFDQLADLDEDEPAEPRKTALIVMTMSEIEIAQLRELLTAWEVMTGPDAS